MTVKEMAAQKLRAKYLEWFKRRNGQDCNCTALYERMCINRRQSLECKCSCHKLTGDATGTLIIQ